MIFHHCETRVMKQMNTSLLLALALTGAAVAQSLETQQKDLLQKLTDLDNETPGLSISGNAFYRGQISELSGAAVLPESPTFENRQYIEADLDFVARPTRESRATVSMRAHQDFQKGYDEGPNPIRIHWWSYDGSFLDSKGWFSFGDMQRIYSPLTMTTPLPEILGEPKILARRRLESMDYRHQSAGRLMQGLNAGWQDSVGPFERILVEGTLSRLRNQGKKSDLLFIDNASVARYMAGVRAQADLNIGVGFGVNLTSTMDRVRNSRNYNHPFAPADSLPYESNLVYSGELRLDGADMLGMSDRIRLGLNAEIAFSNYRLDRDVKTPYIDGYTFSSDEKWYQPNGQDSITVLNLVPRVVNRWRLLKGEAVSDQAIKLDLDIGYRDPQSADVALKASFLMNGSQFISELAQSPAYIGTKNILNADALVADADLLRATYGSTLESMYFTAYQVDAETQRNGLSADNEPPVSQVLFNNFVRQHYFRNAWASTTLKPSELTLSALMMDLAAGIALPYGVATANRVGPLADFRGRFLNNTIALLAKWAMLQEKEHVGGGDKTQFNLLGVGTEIHAGSLLRLGREIDVQAGYETNDDNSAAKRKFARISAGLNAELGWGFSILGGWQSVSKKLNDLVGTSTLEVSIDESLWMAGVEYELAKGAKLSVEYGQLVQKYEAPGLTAVQLDRALMTAQVKVEF